MCTVKFRGDWALPSKMASDLTHCLLKTEMWCCIPDRLIKKKILEMEIQLEIQLATFSSTGLEILIVGGLFKEVSARRLRKNSEATIT